MKLYIFFVEQIENVAFQYWNSIIQFLTHLLSWKILPERGNFRKLYIQL